MCGARSQLDIDIAQWTDRPAVQLDPVEHAVLLVSVFELTSRPDREAANRLYARLGFTLRETNVYRFSVED